METRYKRIAYAGAAAATFYSILHTNGLEAITQDHEHLPEQPINNVGSIHPSPTVSFNFITYPINIPCDSKYTGLNNFYINQVPDPSALAVLGIGMLVAAKCRLRRPQFRN